MKKCVVQLLQGKTRILCTHRLEFVDQADTVVLMEEGTIVRTGRKDFQKKTKKDQEISVAERWDLQTEEEEEDARCWLEGELTAKM